jgi:hypothetical protein
MTRGRKAHIIQRDQKAQRETNTRLPTQVSDFSVDDGITAILSLGLSYLHAKHTELLSNNVVAREYGWYGFYATCATTLFYLGFGIISTDNMGHRGRTWRHVSTFGALVAAFFHGYSWTHSQKDAA